MSQEYRTPDAKPIVPLSPPRRALAGLDAAGRAAARDAHTREWLRARRNGITGTDVPALLGIDPDRHSLTEVYARKVHGHNPAPTAAARLGHDLEPAVRARFTEATGLRTRRCGLLANREQPWMRATPDDLTSDGAGVEYKTTTEYAAAEWDDYPADHAMAQAQWYMAVTGATHWWVAVLFRDSGRFEYYDVDRDDELIAVIVERAAAFWHGNVAQQCAPPLDDSPSTLEAVRATVATDVDPDKVVEGGEEAAALRRRMARVTSQIAGLNREKDQITAEMLALAGDAGILAAYGRKAAYTRRNGTFASAAYTRDNPETADRYMRPVDKLDHKAVLRDDPRAAAYISRAVRPAGGRWDADAPLVDPDIPAPRVALAVDPVNA